LNGYLATGVVEDTAVLFTICPARHFFFTAKFA